MKYTLPFNLAQAQRGAEFGTASGSRCEFIAHVPSRREHLRLVVRDLHSDKLYSHYEDGRHLETSVRQLFMASQEPAATKSVAYVDLSATEHAIIQRVINDALKNHIVTLEKKIAAAEKQSQPLAKIVRWLAVWQNGDDVIQPRYWACCNVLCETEQLALERAKLSVNCVKGFSNPRAIRVEI